MEFLSWLTRNRSPDDVAAREASARRRTEITTALREQRVPRSVEHRLQETRAGRLPWIAALTPAELMIVRGNGFVPISMLTATCCLQIRSGTWSFAKIHQHGWTTAIERLRLEAKAAGANVVLDVKLRRMRLGSKRRVDFTLIGTAVRVEGLPASAEPLIATLPALEFIQLLKAGIVPVGIAIGAHTEWTSNRSPQGIRYLWKNIEREDLSSKLQLVRVQARMQLYASVRGKGNGVLAPREACHIEYEDKVARVHYLVIGTIIDRDIRRRRDRTEHAPHSRGLPVALEFRQILDMREGSAKLASTVQKHEAIDFSE